MSINFNKILLYFILFIIAIGMIFPMFWMLLISFKSNPQINENLLNLLFSQYSVENYKDILMNDSFLIYFLNSVFVSTSISVANLILCIPIGYSLVRYNGKFNKIVLATVFSVLIIPVNVIMIPLFRMMVNFSWLDTYYSLIIPWIISPFGVFLSKQYMENLPIEIENAAKIDGANSLQILTKIIFPMVKPLAYIIFIYIFLSSWNSFLFPFLFTNSDNMRTLPVGLTFFLGKQSIDWGHLMAGASISAMPILIFFIFFNKKIIEGLTAGALKE